MNPAFVPFAWPNPLGPNDHDHRISLLQLAIDVLTEVDPERNIIHVDEHRIHSEMLGQTVEYAARGPSSIAPAI